MRELERVGRLKRFLAPQIAELIVSSGDEQILESHRREITVVVCDLRGFTAFSETAAPEDVMAVLREYQSGLGTLVDKFEGTVERFTGDGLMVWFNDPLPCSDPCGRATRMGVEMRDCVAAANRTSTGSSSRDPSSAMPLHCALTEPAVPNCGMTDICLPPSP